MGLGCPKPRPLLDRKIRQIRIIFEQSRDVDIGMVLHSLGDAIVDVLRRESHLIFLPFASALQATIARLRAALSASVGLAASAGEGVDTAQNKCRDDTAQE
jgi:hypothetical protein